MHAIPRNEFSVTPLTGRVEATNASSAWIGFYLKSNCGVEYTQKGEMAVVCSEDCAQTVNMLLSIHRDYQRFEILEKIRLAVFEAIRIPVTATWKLTVCPPAKNEYVTERVNEGYIIFDV